MAKKIKDKRQNMSNITLHDQQYHEEKNTYKRMPKENTHKNKDKPSMVTNQNIKFKNKRKEKLAKKIKHIQKLEQNPAVSAIVSPKMTKVTRGKKFVQSKKSELHLQNGKKTQSNLIKQKSNKGRKVKDRTSTQFDNKFNKNGNIREEEKTKKPTISTSGHNLDIKRLQELLVIKDKEKRKEKECLKPQSLRERMMAKLRASRFRYLNESLYNNESSESKKYFKNDPDAFKAYHEGYKQQIEQWPLNPLDIIISSIKKMQKEYIIADFGCGDARLAASVPHKVHSFDFISLNESVTECDIAHTPLLTKSINVVVFCLSLMGTNLKDYIVEANRVLKADGIIKIAEVESRFEKVEDFIKSMSAYGFRNTWKDLSHNLFYFLDFKKENDINTKKDKLPPITLKPCLYKKR